MVDTASGALIKEIPVGNAPRQVAIVGTGTLSVIDLATARQTSTIPVGLEPTARYLNASTLMVANSNDDSVSLVDRATKAVTQTFNVNPLPGSTVGSAPNAITMHRQWVKWSAHQRFAGRLAREDAANPAQLNRIDWYGATGWARSYPDDRRILAPDQVPGRNRPAGDIGGG